MMKALTNPFLEFRQAIDEVSSSRQNPKQSILLILFLLNYSELIIAVVGQS